MASRLNLSTRPVRALAITTCVSLCFSAAIATGQDRKGDARVSVVPAAPSPLLTLVSNVNETLDLRTSTMFRFAAPVGPGQPFSTTLSLDGASCTLVLQPHSTRAPGYRLLAQTADGSLATLDPGPVRTLRGVVGEFPGSVVAASLLDSGLFARLVFPNGAEYWIEPIAGRVPGVEADSLVLYHADDAIGGVWACGNENSDADHRDPAGLPLQPGARGGGNVVAELACDADYEYFLAYGSAANVEARINAVINAMNVQYERDVSITHQITTIVVRTSSNDPYTHKKSRNRLSQFRNEWNTTLAGIPRDVAQLFTGVDLAGGTIGEAWGFGVVCDLQNAYSQVQSDFSSNFACVTDLSAHELGHCWDARHCSCSSYTMNSFITCTNRFNPSATIPVIAAFRDSIGCLGGGAPACSVPGECDDGDPCTTDTCVDNACVNTPIDCDDGDPCTNDSCVNGVCIHDPIPNCGGGAIVDCITYTTIGGRNSARDLILTITVLDEFGVPVSGASVTVAVSANGSLFGTGTNTTDSSGRTGFRVRRAANACWVTDVTAISAGGLVFDGSEPSNGFLKGTDPTPDADCRSGSDPCGG